NQALKAFTLFKRDRDYLGKDGEVVIGDEFTGRQQPGRRWADGLHQAVEGKEGVKVQQETQTLDTITYQEYLRLYQKLAGRTGTRGSSPKPGTRARSRSRPTWRAVVPTSCSVRVWRTVAGCISSAPSGTRAAGSTTSCVVAPAGRVTRARPDSSWRWMTT